MVKEKQLKKRLIKLGVILTVVLAVLGTGAAALYNYAAGLDAEQRKIQNGLNRIRSDITSSEKRAKEAEEYLKLYENISGEGDAAHLVALERDVAQRWIGNIARRYEFVKLDGTFDPIKPIANKDYQKKTLQGIHSPVSLRVAAPSDELVLRFIHTLIEEFPGYVRLKRVDITRRALLTDAMVAQARTGNIPELVSATIEFDWIGVQEVQELQGGGGNVR